MLTSSLFLNRTLRTQLSLVHPNTEQHVLKKQANQVVQHDQHAKERQFIVGQQVMVRNLRPGHKWISGVITKQLGPVTFLVKTASGMVWKRHVDHLQDNTTAQKQNTEIEKDAESDTDSFLPSSISPAENTTEETAEETDTIRNPSRTRNPPDRYM